MMRLAPHWLAKAHSQLTHAAKARVEPTLTFMATHRVLIKVRKAMWVGADLLPWILKGILILGLFGSLVWFQRYAHDWMLLNEWDHFIIGGILGGGAFFLLVIFIVGSGWVNEGIDTAVRWLENYLGNPEFDALFLKAKFGELPASHPFKHAFERFSGKWLSPIEWRILAYAQYDAAAQEAHLTAVLPEAPSTTHVRPRL